MVNDIPQSNLDMRLKQESNQYWIYEANIDLKKKKQTQPQHGMGVIDGERANEDQIERIILMIRDAATVLCYADNGWHLYIYTGMKSIDNTM